MRRKRKRILSALMVVLMAIGMAGCGDAAANTSSEPIRSSEAESQNTIAESKTEETERPSEGPASSSAEESTPISKSDEAVTDKEENEGANLIVQDSNEISGLIIATISLGIQASTCDIISFDPVSGETKSVSNFQFQNDSEYLYTFAVSNGFFSGSYHFDEGYTRMAGVRISNVNQETHAGWFTDAGEFFDVTEAVGMASQSDFADSVEQTALGFTDNGLFVFCDNSDYPNTRCYSVLIDNVSPNTVVEGFVAPRSTYSTSYTTCISLYNVISDWIDDTHCIMTIRNGNPTTSVIFDTVAETETAYIPGNSRKNWNGRLSPDGTQIAFTSVPLAGSEKPDIFIMPINGGEPARIADHDFIMTDTNVDFDLYALSSGKSCCMLIDWR